MKSRSRKHSVSVNRHRSSGSTTSSRHNGLTHWVIRDCSASLRWTRRLRRSARLMRSRLCVEKLLVNGGLAQLNLLVHADFLLPFLFWRSFDTLSVREQPTLCKLRQDLPFSPIHVMTFTGNVKLTFPEGKWKGNSFFGFFALRGLLRKATSKFSVQKFFRAGWKLSAQQIYRFGYFQIFPARSLYNGNWRSFFCPKKFFVSLPSCVLDFLAFTAHNEGEM